MPIYIPEGERAHLAVLLQATPELLDAIHNALQHEAPSLKQRDLVARLAHELDGVSGATLPALQSIVRSLVSLYQFRVEDSMDPQEVAEDFAEGARASGDEKLREAAAGWEGFKQRLAKLLSLDDTLGVTARAGYIAAQTPRHFHAARVLTDARPIYQADATQGPVAFVVLHSLQVDYYEDDEDRTWFLSLDGDDLEALKVAVDRALTKEHSLRSLLEKTQVPIMSWRDEADDGD
jgi:hypothetical protein